MPSTLRPYHPSDLPGMYRVCLLTADAGADATALYRDPDLVGHVYLGPYPTSDPGLSFVVQDDEGIAGYIVGTADTAAFDAWADEHWWPVLRQRYPLRDDPRDGTADHLLAQRVHGLDRDEAPAGYPAHLHIDLLPRIQGQGWGRRLISAFTDELRRRGVPGVHLRVDERNLGARAFYTRLGFAPDEDDVWLLPLGSRG